MNKKAKKELREDLLSLYKSITPRLFIKYKQYDALELRMEMAKIIMDHAIQRYKESIDKKLRTKRARKERKMVAKDKEWLDVVDVKDQDAIAKDRELDEVLGL